MKKAGLFLFACCIGVAFAYNGKNVNAKAVSVNWKNVSWAYSGAAPCATSDNTFADGAIVLYTIENSLVTGADTLYSRATGLAHYPAFNLSGTKVAFYRESVAEVAGSGNCGVANGGKNTISVVDVATKQVTNLVDLANAPNAGHAEIATLDWPAGDWIYYEKMHDAADVFDNGTSIDIWKVNVNTKENVKVCNFSNLVNNQEAKCTYFRRFSLSINGTRMAAQLMGKYGCTLTPDVSGVNAVFNFPGGCDFGDSDKLNYQDGCNIAISPSGNYVGSYIGGAHVDLIIHGVDGTKTNGPEITTINQSSHIQPWSGNTVNGTGAELVRWAVNSDKWVMQEIGYNPGDGHADNLAKGSNQVVCNWVDQVAINISKNRNIGTGDNAINFNNCAGDFFVIDPVNNPNGTKYEDLQGVWHEAVGASAVKGLYDQNRKNNNSTTMNGSRIRVPLSGNGQWNAEIFSLDGGLIRLQRGAGAEAYIATTGLSAGVYMIKISNSGETNLQRFVVR